MPKRLLLALILLAAAPLVLLGILTTSTYHDHQRLAREQIDGLYQSRLIAFENEVDRVISEYEDELDSQFDASSVSNTAFRSKVGFQSNAGMQESMESMMMQRAPTDDQVHSFHHLRRSDSRSSIVRTSLIVDRRGNLIYPPTPLTASSEEASLYQSLETLASNRPATSAPGPSSNKIGKVRSSIEQMMAPASVWQVWYMDEGMQLVYWQNIPGTSRSLGTLLERSRWIADLTAALPDSGPIREPHTSSFKEELASIKSTRSVYGSSKSESPKWTLSTGYTTLVDQRGHVVYRWGTQVEGNLKPLASRSLPAPLSDWTFEAFDDDPIKNVSQMPTFLSLAGLGVLLVSLGGYVLSSVRRQSNEAQSRVSFASQVSHELRTPLTNIRLYAELAESDLESMPNGSNTEILRKRLRVIDTESQRLGRLVSGVLEVIRDPRKVRPPRCLATSPDEVIEQVVEQFRPTFEALQIEVDRSAQASEPVMIDPDLVEMILVNLLSNVEKYAADGKWIGIESNIAGQELIVRICDAGKGILKRHQKTIFAPFERLDDSISAPNGTGIGLTIARRMAQRHGGTLSLIDSSRYLSTDSTRDAQASGSRSSGACFELRLPLGDIS